MINKLFVLLLVVVLSIISSYFKSKNKRIYKVLNFLLILLLSIVFAFREFIFAGDIGTDYEEYRTWFLLKNEYNLFSSFQNFGFNFLIVMCKRIINNYYFFLFICGFIINYFVVRFINENKQDFVIPCIIYFSLFYFSTFNILRQWIACAIFLNSFKHIKERKFFKYLISILVAFLFHDTSLLLLLLYPILYKENNFYNTESILLILSIVLFFSCNHLIAILNKICMIVGVDYFQKYSIDYLSSQSGNMTIIIISLFFLFLLNLKFRKNKDILKQNIIYVNYFLILIPFAFLSIRNGIFTRYLIYFECALLPIIPMSLKLFDKKGAMLGRVILLTLFSIKFLL